MRAIISLLLLFSLYFVNADDADLCRLFKDGTKLRKPGSCLEYITCQDGIGEVSACITPALYSNAKQSCVEATALTDADYCANRCEGKNGVWVADLSSCHGYYYCQNGIGLYGNCPEYHHFDQSTQMCIQDQTSMCVDVAEICQIAPSGAKFRDETQCNSYYSCSSSNKLSKTTCKSGQYFDVEDGTCKDKSFVQCTAHPYPKEVCGKDGSAKSGKFVADQATCRGYFYCANLGYVADLAPTWGQCPEGTFFNPKTEQCDDPKDVACSYNRCDGRGTRLVQSHNNDCHNFFECVNSLPIKEHSCVGDLFFDEEISACGKNIIYYASCDRCTLTTCKPN